MSKGEAEIVDEIWTQWKRLWHDRVDDKVRAEGIAVDDYKQLFIQKGTVIHATRDCKDLKFKEILRQHKIVNTEKYLSSDPYTGGLTKFIKTNITQNKKVDHTIAVTKKGKQQLRKKNGRGWLNIY
jgi:hypothetical protein